jgi:O-antigen/teichoic acid export membrane protein
VLAFNAVVTYLLIGQFGMIGAAWGRLAAEVFGFLSALMLTRWAFPVPLPVGRVTRVLISAIVMAIVVQGLEATLAMDDKDALALLIPAGITSYLAMCWLLDIAKSRHRMSRCLLIARARLAPLTRPR